MSLMIACLDGDIDLVRVILSEGGDEIDLQSQVSSADITWYMNSIK